MTKNIVLVKAEDWQGFYVGGKAVLQGHSFSTEDVLAALGICCDVKYANDDWLGCQGYLPVDIKDVVFDE